MSGRRTCPVETQTRKLPVTALKWYPVIRADFRKLLGGSVCSQVEAEFISWYTCSSERKTLVWKQIMHAWLIELCLELTRTKKKKRFRQFHVFFQSRPDSHLYSQIHTVYTVWIYTYIYMKDFKNTVKMNLESSWVSVLLLSACFFKCLQLIEHL